MPNGTLQWYSWRKWATTFATLFWTTAIQTNQRCTTLRELQALNPSNHSAHTGGSSNNNAEGGDSGGSGEEEPTVKTKVKSRQRRGSKKASSSVSNGQAKSSEGGGKGITGGNNGKKKRMRRRASLPAVGDGKGSKKGTSSNSTSNGKGKGSSSSASSKKDAKPPRKKELSVEEALAQADAVLSSLSVAQPPPRSRSSNNERIQQKKKKHGPQRPLSAGLLEEHYDTLSKLEKNHSKKRVVVIGTKRPATGALSSPKVVLCGATWRKQARTHSVAGESKKQIVLRVVYFVPCILLYNLNY